jgi:hypothetical protein
MTRNAPINLLYLIVCIFACHSGWLSEGTGGPKTMYYLVLVQIIILDGLVEQCQVVSSPCIVDCMF